MFILCPCALALVEQYVRVLKEMSVCFCEGICMECLFSSLKKKVFLR